MKKYLKLVMTMVMLVSMISVVSANSKNVFDIVPQNQGKKVEKGVKHNKFESNGEFWEKELGKFILENRVEYRQFDEEYVRSRRKEMGELNFRDINANGFKVDLPVIDSRAKKAMYEPLEYRFSKNPLGYVTEFFVEGKGYMEFLKGKPYKNEFGDTMFPMKAYGQFLKKVVWWDETDESINIGEFYSENSKRGSKKYGEIKGTEDKMVSYELAEIEKYRIKEDTKYGVYDGQITDYGIEYFFSGGTFIDYLRSTCGTSALKGSGMSSVKKLNEKEKKNEWKYYIPYQKDGVWYVSNRFVKFNNNGYTQITTLVDNVVYIGSKEYIDKITEEKILEPATKIIDKQDPKEAEREYNQMMEDLFKNIKPYSEYRK